MRDTDVAPTTVDGLANAIDGRLLTPTDPDYDEARAVYNAMHDRRPALIARCASTADVATAVRYAADHDLDIAVRGGGHSGPGFGTCDDGLVIDLGPLNDVEIDPGQGLAVAGGGCTWHHLDAATHIHGLATTGGTISSTGIAGLTLGGGFGHMTRRCGLTCDNLVEAEVVTAAGETIVANDETHADLFWALRGGGGNFGIVTRFTYRLFPTDQIQAGPLVFDLTSAPAVLEAYGDMAVSAPDDFGGIAGLAQLPPFPFLDESAHLQPGCLVLVCWTGDPSKLDEVIAPLTAAAEPLGVGIGPMPYPVINTLFDELLPHGLRHYWKGSFTSDLPAAARTHVEHAASVPTPESGTYFFPIGGAATRFSGDAAFGHRDQRFNVVVAGSWRESSLDHEARSWVRGYHEALQPHSTEAGYINFLGEDDADRIDAGYGPNLDRLAAVKAVYDPDNRFHINHNIAPRPLDRSTVDSPRSGP